MQHPIQACVIEASYNVDATREISEKKILAQSEGERSAGKPQNHILRRNAGDLLFEKFSGICLYLKDGVGAPPLAFSFAEAESTGLDTIVVGNEHTAKACEQYSAFSKKKKLTFVHEGKIDEISRANTMRKSLAALNEKGMTKAISVSPDSPWVSLNPIIQDPATFSHDMVLYINVMEVAKDYFPRSPHWKLGYGGLWLLAKEPQYWILNLGKVMNNRIGTDLPDMIYESRKFYGSGKSMVKTLAKLAAMDDNFWKSVRRVDNTLQMLGADSFWELAKFFSRKLAGRPETPETMPRIDAFRLQKIADYILGNGIKTCIRPCTQPGAMVDIDSLEDLVFVQAMIDLDPSVHPHYSRISDFAKYTGGRWNRFANDWIGIGNAMLEKYKIPAQYDRKGKMHQALFSEDALRSEIKLLKDYAYREEIFEKQMF